MDSQAATLIEVICAAVQVLFGGLSIGAAWSIARAEKRRADDAPRNARAAFLEAVVSIGREAALETEKALKAPIGIENWRQRLTDLREALQPIRAAGPAEAELLVSVARLSRALDIPPGLPIGPHPAEALIKQHRGSIALELAKLDAMRTGAEVPRWPWLPFSGIAAPLGSKAEAALIVVDDTCS